MFRLDLAAAAPRRGRLPVCVLLCFFVAMAGCGSKDWRAASREPAGLAPSPSAIKDAVLQVYGASAWGWRGWFAVHTWIAAKPSNASAPDRAWYGARPRLLREFRGGDTDGLISAVDKAARGYPWPNTYKAFPGPNSNTFTAWIGRQVPELGLELPFSAIGSGYSN